jgi:tetratricopeptide (TPR) repeat protein
VPARRRLLFALAAVVVGLLPLILLEAGLRLFGVGDPAGGPDPFAGFNRRSPLFERHGVVYRTARARAPYIAPSEFPAGKPPQGYRIFCFGGSTVYGHPYLGDTAFPRWLELELAAGDPARSCQAINCGGISYASYRIVPMVQEVLHYQPDLIVVATGHNEFLEDRTYGTLKGRSSGWAWVQARAASLHLVALARRWFRPSPLQSLDAAPASDAGVSPNARLDNVSGYASYRRDEAWHQRVIAQYEDSVRAMVAACRAAHVPILLIRLGSNLRDCPPFKSEHRAGLAPARELDWQAACDLGLAAEKTDLSRALQYYQEAAAIDGEYALINYRIARVLDRLGRPAEALAYYERARDEDICPLRISAPLEQALVRVARETGAPLLDAADLLAARSPDRIPGNDWYLDHVHPTIGGHQAIAQAIAAQLRAAGLTPSGMSWSEEQRRAAYSTYLAQLGPAYFADGRRRVGRLDLWAQRQRLAEEAAPHDAGGFARLGFLRLDLGEEDAAGEALREALKRDAAIAVRIDERARELEAQGRPDAVIALRRQVRHD